MSISPAERVRWLASAAVIVLVVLILLTSLSKPNASADATLLVRADDPPVLSEPSPLSSGTAPTPGTQIGVDVIGAVQQPGVYYLDPAARIVDLIEAAGGFAPDANREQMNLASRLKDGQQVYVPRVGERSQAAAEPVAQKAGGMVNLNQADTAELDALTGIGPATAEAIVDYRESNGPFKRVEDLQNVKGIGPALFSKIKDQITIDP
jgi:competence protein ComEA